MKSLRDAQPDGLAPYRIPVSCQTLLDRLRTCGATALVACPRGNRWRVASWDAFDRIVHSLLPNGLDVDPNSISGRRDGVVQLADAKSARVGRFQGVFVRATKPDVLLRAADTEDAVLPISDLTRAAGGAALLLGTGIHWTFQGLVATIENEEAFWRHDLVLPGVDLAIYARGRMSQRLLDWLRSPCMADCRFIHWGDYDPVGVREYVRLRNACQGRVAMHIPEDLDALIERFGKRELIEGQVTELKALRSESIDPVVQQMLTIFDRHRKGLEQELLGLDCRAPVD